jgi:hypothetical protein
MTVIKHIKKAYKSTFMDDFKKAYKEYRKKNSVQKLPEYTPEIGELFNDLFNHIRKIGNKSTSSTFDNLATDNYKIREYLNKTVIKEIVLHDGTKKSLTITNSILVDLIEKYAYKITGTPLSEPKKKNPTKNLTLLLKSSHATISALKLKGITSDMLVRFIENSIGYAAKGSLWLNPNFIDNISDPEASVIQIKSVEAFNKSLQRVNGHNP